MILLKEELSVSDYGIGHAFESCCNPYESLVKPASEAQVT